MNNIQITLKSKVESTSWFFNSKISDHGMSIFVSLQPLGSSQKSGRYFTCISMLVQAFISIFHLSELWLNIYYLYSSKQIYSQKQAYYSFFMYVFTQFTIDFHQFLLLELMVLTLLVWPWTTSVCLWLFRFHYFWKRVLSIHF